MRRASLCADRYADTDICVAIHVPEARLPHPHPRRHRRAARPASQRSPSRCSALPRIDVSRSHWRAEVLDGLCIEFVDWDYQATGSGINLRRNRCAADGDVHCRVIVSRGVSQLDGGRKRGARGARGSGCSREQATPAAGTAEAAGPAVAHRAPTQFPAPGRALLEPSGGVPVSRLSGWWSAAPFASCARAAVTRPTGEPTKPLGCCDRPGACCRRLGRLPVPLSQSTCGNAANPAPSASERADCWPGHGGLGIPFPQWSIA